MPSLGPQTAATIDRLGDLSPSTLALMHGPSFHCMARRSTVMAVASSVASRSSTATAHRPELTPISGSGTVGLGSPAATWSNRGTGEVRLSSGLSSSLR